MKHKNKLNESVKEYYDEYFNYNKETGIITWKKLVKGNTRGKLGEEPGWLNSEGYKMLKINGVNLFYHRVVWYCECNEIPNKIDHINGNKLDNRLSNLRNTDNQENCKNQKKRLTNTSGFTGVNYHKKNKKWTCSICVNGKSKYLGSYKTIEEAVEARKKAEIEYGFHENHGR